MNRHQALVAVIFAVVMLGFITSVCAQAPYDDPWTPTGWAWSKIRDGEIADFRTRNGCNGRLDPVSETGWDAPCRQIPAQFLVDILTVPKWRDQISRHRVSLIGAHINGTIDLRDAEITPEVELNANRIEGDVELVGSLWRRSLSLSYSTIDGGLSALRLRSESDVNLGHAAVKDDVVLGSAQITGSLFMNDRATFYGVVQLIGAKIGGDLEMDGSLFSSAVNADHLNVEGGGLLMNNATFGGDINLVNAKVKGSLEMKGSVFSGKIEASPINVEGGLFMDEGAIFRERVGLVGAKVAALHLSGSIAWQVNLSNAQMGEFLFSGLGWWCAKGTASVGNSVELAPAHWPLGNDSWRNVHCVEPEPAGVPTLQQPGGLPALLLRNAHLDEFQDSVDAWPP